MGGWQVPEMGDAGEEEDFLSEGDMVEGFVPQGIVNTLRLCGSCWISDLDVGEMCRPKLS